MVGGLTGRGSNQEVAILERFGRSRGAVFTEFNHDAHLLKRIFKCVE